MHSMCVVQTSKSRSWYISVLVPAIDADLSRSHLHGHRTVVYHIRSIILSLTFDLQPHSPIGKSDRNSLLTNHATELLGIYKTVIFDLSCLGGNQNSTHSLIEVDNRPAFFRLHQ